jgi:hypothetical protein
VARIPVLAKGANPLAPATPSVVGAAQLRSAWCAYLETLRGGESDGGAGRLLKEARAEGGVVRPPPRAG